VEGTSGGQPLDTSAVRDQATSGLPLLVLLTRELGEAPIGGDMHLLAAGELEFRVAKSILSDSLVLVESTDGHEHGADVHTGGDTVRLTVGATHTGLQTIRTGTGKHLIDTQNVERVDADAHVEEILTGILYHGLVGGNTGSFQGLGRDLLVLIGDEMHTERELVTGILLAGNIVDTDLGIRDTTTEPTLRVRLVLAVAVAACGTTTHGGKENEWSTIQPKLRPVIIISAVGASIYRYWYRI